MSSAVRCPREFTRKALAIKSSPTCCRLNRDFRTNESQLRPSPVKVRKTSKRLVFYNLEDGVKDTPHVGVLKIPESERGDKDVTQRSVSEVCRS